MQSCSLCNCPGLTGFAYSICAPYSSLCRNPSNGLPQPMIVHSRLRTTLWHMSWPCQHSCMYGMLSLTFPTYTHAAGHTQALLESVTAVERCNLAFEEVTWNVLNIFLPPQFLFVRCSISPVPLHRSCVTVLSLLPTSLSHLEKHGSLFQAFTSFRQENQLLCSLPGRAFSKCVWMGGGFKSYSIRSVWQTSCVPSKPPMVPSPVWAPGLCAPSPSSL